VLAEGFALCSPEAVRDLHRAQHGDSKQTNVAWASVLSLGVLSDSIKRVRLGQH